MLGPSSISQITHHALVVGNGILLESVRNKDMIQRACCVGLIQRHSVPKLPSDVSIRTAWKECIQTLNHHLVLLYLRISLFTCVVSPLAVRRTFSTLNTVL